MGEGILFWLVIGAIVYFTVGQAVVAKFMERRRLRSAKDLHARNETLFRAMFPELQPHFHPARLVEFVKARLDRGPVPAVSRWKDPAGFPAAAMAESALGEKGRERVILRGPSGGGVIGEFHFEKVPEGGVLRVGKGKLTVNLREPSDPRVRYWHPDREFKWSQAGWVFTTPVADAPIESSSHNSSFSSSDSSSGASRATAAAAGIVGLGGTFDGGGASAGWDDARPDSASSAAAGVSSGVLVTGDSPESSSDHAAESASDSSGDDRGDSGGGSSGDSSGDSGSTSY